MMQQHIFPFPRAVTDKLLQYAVSLGGGLLAAIDTSVNFFIPCLIAVLLDVFTAYMLGRRVHKLHPDRADGKFKSEYKMRIMVTMIVVFAAIIVANYVDEYVIKDDSVLAVRYVVGVFMFYECWSILENWSSENPNKIARALQRIMVNKAERHLQVPLSDIMLNEPATPSGSIGSSITEGNTNTGKEDADGKQG